MYQYSSVDQRLVEERVVQFRDQTKRYLKGQLSEEAFRPLRLMNGLYFQTHAPMLRIAIPYGLLSSEQLRKLAYVARTYDRSYGHLTTRQNIQFNWLKIEQVPDLLADLATVQMHAIQTSGNCIRNITADHMAGAIEGELEDPRPYCEIMRQWSTLHPEFSFLPRKFKIAMSGAQNDRAATQVHDIGIQIVRDPSTEEVGFRILVGGGLGRTPVIGKVIRDFLPKKHLLSYLEAILRIYNLAGRRDNKYKARLKILVNSLGIERFTQLVENEWRQLKDSSLTLDDFSITQFRDHFQPFEYAPATSGKDAIAAKRNNSPAFSAWYEHNTQSHKVAGYRIVTLSVKAPQQAPGDLTDVQMDGVADLADQYSFGQIRVSHEQNLILADIAEADIPALWRELVALDLATPNIGSLTDIICCPGLDFCSLANAGAIPIAKQINARFDDLDYLYDLGEIKIKISGCMNACGHHHVGHIGILGVDKKGEEWYQITLGGSAEENASLGKIIGPSVPKDDVAETIAKILDTFIANRQDQESFLDAVHRLGIPPFKEAVYG
ncbi:MAG: nitrite/sulfite reductase [Gammaproteobacteria bacterium]|nr:nitrite/sulfite reductase [Gammaproteobacteria bacterium]